MELDEIEAYCTNLYRPTVEKLTNPATKLELPELDYTSGVLTMKGGSLSLGENGTIKYRELQHIDLMTVQVALAHCSSAQRTYECAIFADPKEQPEARAAMYFADMVARVSKVSSAVKRYEDPSATAQERASAAAEIKAIVESAPERPDNTPPASPPASGGSPESRDEAVPPVVSDMELRAADDRSKVTGLLQETAHLRASVEKLALQGRLFEAALANTEAERAKWLTCKKAWSNELADVQAVRREIRSAIGNSAEVESESPYSPLSFVVEHAGFAVCEAALSPEMTRRLDGVRKALELAAARRPAGRLIVRIDGFSDQQPILRDKNAKKCATHYFSNTILAQNRARSVWEALASPPISQLERPVIIGHDDGHICDCANEKRDFSICPAEADACHCCRASISVEI